MTDIAALQSEIMAEISAAADEAALEALRVATLGKKGSISALLATMGKLDPEERKIKGPQFNGLKDAVTAAIENLPEREQLVMQLYYVEEMNLKEIGEVLGVSESRISQILSTVVKKIRSQLQLMPESASESKRKAS